MKENHNLKKRISFVMALAILLIAPLAGHSQSASTKEPISAGTLAEQLWQSGEAQWSAFMISSLGTDETSFKEFIDFNQSAYFRDRGGFFAGVSNGDISEANADAFFADLKTKYLDLWKMEGNDYKIANRPTPPELPGPMAACNPSCYNINFQAKTLIGWSAYWAVDNSTTAAVVVSNKTGGPAGSVTQAGGPDPNTGNTYQVTLMTTPGSDPVVGGFIPFTPPLGGLAVRLGDGDRNGYGIGIIEQNYTVDPSSPILTVQYAVVMENPSGHGGYEQPWFKMEVLDQNGVAIPGCGQYFVVSGPNLPGFKAFNYNFGTVYARPWTTAFIPLYNYIGQCITVRWTASDCGQGGHFGYAYVSATCAQLDLRTSVKRFCLNQKNGVIKGPPGAANYQWSTVGGCIQGSTTLDSIVICGGGKYSLIIASSAGAQCVDTFTVDIPSVPSGPPPTPCFSATRVCAGSPTNFNGTCSSPLAGTNFFWDFYNSGNYNDSSGATPVWTFNVGGTYAVRMHIVTADSCESDTTINVIVDAPNVNTLPTWTSTITDASVCGQCNGKFSMTITPGNIRDTIKTSFDGTYALIGGGVAPSSVGGAKNCGAIWNANGSYTLSFCNLCAGKYEMYIIPASATPPSNCTPGGFYGDTLFFAITSAGVVVNASISSFDASCGLNNGSATLTGLGGTAAYTFSWTNPVLPAGATQTGLSPGQYKVDIKDANGCTGNTTVTIGNTPQISAPAVPFDVTCFGAGDGSATVTPTAGVGPFTYAWAPSGGTDSIATGLLAGTYTVTVTDKGGCTGVVKPVIKQPTQVVVNITSSVTQVNCGQTGSATAKASGGYPPHTYKWSNGTYYAAATGLSAGSYIVTATDALGCTATTTVNVTINNGPNVDAGPNASICPGGQTTLNAVSTTPNATYSWAPATYLSCTTCPNPDANPTATTQYTVYVSDGSACSVSDFVEVKVNGLPNVIVSPPSAVCVGTDVTLTASGAFSYVWSNGQSATASILVTPVVGPNSYTVTGVDTNGCINTASTVVTGNASPNISISPPSSICLGATATITASGGLAYSWSNGDSGVGVTSISVTPPVGPNTYTVIVADQSGCTSTGSTVLTVNPSVVLPPFPTVYICQGSNAVLTASGGTSYLWSTTETTSSITVMPSVVTTYTVDVTNASGCTANGSVTVDFNPPLNVTTNAAPDICIGSNAQISANPNGVVGYTYTWTPTTDLSDPAAQDPFANPTATTTYTVEVNDINGCNGSAQITVTVNPLPPIVANLPVTVCLGSNASLSASGGAFYSWSDGQIGNPINVTPLVSGTTNYTVTGADGNGCVNTDFTSVFANQPPVIAANPDSTICTGDMITVTVSGATSYLWTPPTGLSSDVVPNPTANPATTTTYTIVGTDGNGCTSSNTVTVIVVPPPIADAGPDADICVGQNVQLNASGGLSYSWSPPDGLSSTNISNPVSTPANTITYTVEALSATTCPPSTDEVTITVHPIPNVMASSDTAILAGMSAQLTSVGNGIAYNWNPPTGLSCTNCSDPLASPLLTTQYIVTTTDQYGCVNFDTVLIKVEDIITLYVPTAFTPFNYDERNSLFYAYGVGIRQFEFFIFDRWGALVFETNDPTKGWDGTYNGEVVQQDVYVWLAKAVSITGKTISKTGPVTVLR